MTTDSTNNGMMKVYHGSDTPVSVIDLSMCELHKDFGQGFYVTKNYKHAKIWADNKAEWSGKTPHVSEFDFIRSAFANKEYKTLQFDGYSVEWLKFIVKNRDTSTNERQHDYDIVEGPIADDKVQRQLKSYLAKLITEEDFLAKLQYHESTHQICFCTTKSLQTLKSADKEIFLIKCEDIIKQVIEEFVRGQKISDVEAYELVYGSTIIDDLFDESTGLYNKSWREIYEMLRIEM